MPYGTLGFPGGSPGKNPCNGEIPGLILSQEMPGKGISEGQLQYSLGFSLMVLRQCESPAMGETQSNSGWGRSEKVKGYPLQYSWPGDLHG